MPDERDRADRATIALGVLAMVLLSANFAAARHGLANGLTVLDIVALRFAVASPICIALLWRIGLGGLSPWRAGALALVAGAPYFLMNAAGLRFAPANHAAILNPGGTIVFGILLGVLVLRERPGPGVFLGVPLVLAGLGLIGSAGLLSGDARTPLGDLIFFASGAVWAVFGVLMRRWRISGLRAGLAAIAFSLPVVPLHLLLRGPATILGAPREALLQAIYQGVFAGVVAIIFYSRAIAALGTARGALLPPLVPALGVLWAWLLLDERVTPLQLAGMATVIAGMLCGALWPSAQNRRDAAVQTLPPRR